MSDSNVYLIDDPNLTNTLIFGTTQPVTLQDIRHNLALVTAPLAVVAAQSTLSSAELRPSPYHGQVFTDDLSPVERLIDEIIFGFVTAR